MERTRDKVMYIRLTKDEHKDITEKAKALELSKTTLVLNAVKAYDNK